MTSTNNIGIIIKQCQIKNKVRHQHHWWLPRITLKQKQKVILYRTKRTKWSMLIFENLPIQWMGVGRPCHLNSMFWILPQFSIYLPNILLRNLRIKNTTYIFTTYLLYSPQVNKSYYKISHTTKSVTFVKNIYIYCREHNTIKAIFVLKTTVAIDRGSSNEMTGKQKKRKEKELETKWRH